MTDLICGAQKIRTLTNECIYSRLHFCSTVKFRKFQHDNQQIWFYKLQLRCLFGADEVRLLQRRPVPTWLTKKEIKLNY